MGTILNRYFLPHPPAAIPEVGKKTAEQLKTTIDGFLTAAKAIGDLSPDTIIIITPHGPCFNDFFYMPSQKRISGDFSAFGCKKLILGFDNDVELAEIIADHTKSRGLSAGFVDDIIMKKRNIPYDIDHGVTVPLYFIAPYCKTYKVLPISVPEMNEKDLYRFGILLREAIQKSNRNVIVIATGDLSHKHGEEHGEIGKEFDKTFKKILLDEDVIGFLNFDRKLKENASQCSIDSIRVLLGTLDGFTFIPRILSYEATTNIGYLSAELTCGKPTESIFVHYLDNRKEMLDKEAFPLKLVRYAIEEYLHGVKDPAIPQDTPDEFMDNCGAVFVSLYNNGLLRGCSGTVTPSCPELASEIMQSAIWAASKDPFASPITSGEIDDLSITVDIIHEPEEIINQNELDPAKYGIIVSCKEKSAVMLPNQPRIENIKDQIRAARENAGIHPWHRLKIKRVTVTRYE